jgi:hypothetical protein
LREILGEYNKSAIKPGQFPLTRLGEAIRRARALEKSPDDPDGRWPQNPGSRVYRLLERILPGHAYYPDSGIDDNKWRKILSVGKA